MRKKSIMNCVERDIPHVTLHGGQKDLCESDVFLGEDLSLSLCYLEDLYPANTLSQNALSLDEVKGLDRIQRADLCVHYMIKNHKTLLLNQNQRMPCTEALLPGKGVADNSGRVGSVDLSIVKTEFEHNAEENSVVNSEIAPTHVNKLRIKSEIVTNEINNSEIVPLEVYGSLRGSNVVSGRSLKTCVKPEILTIENSPVNSEVSPGEIDRVVISENVSPKIVEFPEIMILNDFPVKSSIVSLKSTMKSELMQQEESCCGQEFQRNVILNRSSGKEEYSLDNINNSENFETASIQPVQNSSTLMSTTIDGISNMRCPFEHQDSLELSLCDFASFNLPIVLKSLKAALSKAKTLYMLHVKQRGNVVNIFTLPSSLNEMMKEGFTLKFSVSQEAKPLQSEELISYLASFAEKYHRSSDVYVSVNAIEDEKDTLELKLEELSNILSGKDVEISLASKEYCKPYVRRVAILGHSYVDKFNVPEIPWAIQNGEIGVWLGVKKFGVSNANIDTICKHEIWQDFISYKPHLTILVLGSEDITKTCTPRAIAANIVNLMRVIEKDTGGHCKFIGLESRMQHPELSPEEFHKIRNGVNCKLKRIFYSKRRYHSMNMSRKDLIEDGIHLSMKASNKLLRNLMQIAREHFFVGFSATMLQ